MQRVPRPWTFLQRQFKHILMFLRCHVIIFLCDIAITTVFIRFRNLDNNHVHILEPFSAVTKAMQHSTSDKTAADSLQKRTYADGSFGSLRVNPVDRSAWPLEDTRTEVPSAASHQRLSSSLADFDEMLRQRTAGSLLNMTMLGTSGKVINNARIVVIVAYMRTGSTLIGKLIEQHPGTFYLFEPIRTIMNKFLNRQGSATKLTYLDRSTKTFHPSDVTNTVGTEIINWLTCRLELQSEESLMDEFHRDYTTLMKQFDACARPYFRRLNSGQDSQSRQLSAMSQLHVHSSNKSKIYDCLKQATRACSQAPLLAIKFIRLRMRQVETLLPLFPNMKVIHLNRDPRGMINSRLHLNDLYQNNASIEQDIRQECNDISLDLSSSKSILKKYSDRLKIIKYEDLTERPVSLTKEIYEFIGIDFTQNVVHFIEKMTSVEADTCQYCTERKNSSETASKWRYEMTNPRAFGFVERIQTQCRNSNRVLGYLPFTSVRELNDSRVPSRTYTNVSQLLLMDDYFNSSNSEYS